MKLEHLTQVLPPGSWTVQGGYIASSQWVNSTYTAQYPITMTKTACGMAGLTASNPTNVCLTNHTVSSISFATQGMTGFLWMVVGK